MTDDFVKQQARSAAEDIFKAWLVAVQETSWSEKRAFIECVSAGIISAYERVGTLTVEIEQLRTKLHESYRTFGYSHEQAAMMVNQAVTTKNNGDAMTNPPEGAYDVSGHRHPKLCCVCGNRLTEQESD